MAIGDIYADGKPLKGASGMEMCARIVEAGLYRGTAEELWNLSPDGSLAHVYALWYRVLKGEGRVLTIDTGYGIFLPF